MINPNVLAISAEGQTNPLDRTGAPKTFGRLPRIFIAAAISLAAETCLIAALGHPWLPTHQILTAPIAFVAALLFFGRKQLALPDVRAILRAANRHSTRYLALHAGAFLATILLQAAMVRACAAHQGVMPIEIAAWMLLIAATAVTMIAAVLPPHALAIVARQLGIAWVYASACAFLAIFFRAVEYLAWDAPSSWLGNRLAGAAFSGVIALLSLFYSEIYFDPAARIIGTHTFLIHVSGTCSGIEGLGLTLVLTVGWIVYERRRLRLGRAIWLAPLALVVMWCLNLVRLTALILIGAAGHPQLALTGFHTEAGWISFTAVAMGFLVAASRMRFFRVAGTGAELPVPAVQSMAGYTSPVTYLLPFVAILITSLFTRAASTGFEALYPLRLIVVLAIFWAQRKRLARMTWRFGALDVAAGVAIGGAWLLAARHADPATIATGLGALSSPARILWLAARTLAAVATVPLAEELAFRGYLARRITSQGSADPEAFGAVPYACLSVLSIVSSSLAFGAMHGGMWVLGTVSGVVFAVLARRQNSLGSAVVAHASANLVLALAALTRGMYGLW